MYVHSFAQDTSLKLHTASANVTILDTAFHAPQLHTAKRIWIYLPAGYASGKKRYPVIYMYDGQNVFDAYTSACGEWGVDECLDTLISKGKPAAIVVAIDSDPDRIKKYDPDDSEVTGNGKADNYIDFLVKTLKPFIDKQYRTLSSKENTIIAGSSMGGFISYYAMLKYPDYFGKAGVFSPSFSSDTKLNELTDAVAGKQDGKFFFYTGEEESDTNINNMMVIRKKLGSNSSAMIYAVVDSSGKNDEQAWRKWFAEFYCWIIADGFNNVIKPE